MSLFKRIISANIEGTFIEEKYRKAIVINILSYLATTALLYYTFDGIINNKDIIYLGSLSFFSAIGIFNIAFFYFTKNHKIAGNLMVFMMSLLALVLLLKIGTGSTALFWYFVFIPFAIFVLGRYVGSIYLLVLFIITIIYLHNPIDGFTKYPQEFHSRFLFSFFIAWAFSFIFEAVRHHTYKAFVKADKRKTDLLNQIEKQNNKLEKQAELLTDSNTILIERQEEIIQQSNELLEKNQMLRESHHTIQKKNEFIHSGLRYAHSIQKAILPQKTSISKYFKNFILFIPRDIVSGDFYWFSAHPESQTYFIAVADCTGHGVPAAFLSVIGSKLLDEIVNKAHQNEPDKILNFLDEEFIRILNQSDSTNSDGMDIVLCVIKYPDSQNCTIDFAGAKRPLVIINNNLEISTVKGNRHSIGGFFKTKKDFTKNTLKLKQGNKVYLYSDGFIDQNNPERKRFGSSKFYKLLKESDHLEPESQKDFLLNKFREHQQDEKQRDDVTLLSLVL